MSLTSCLKQAGKNLRAQDKTAIHSAARRYRADGMGPDAAARKAVDDRISVVEELIKTEQKAQPARDTIALSVTNSIAPQPQEKASEPQANQTQQSPPQRQEAAARVSQPAADAGAPAPAKAASAPEPVAPLLTSPTPQEVVDKQDQADKAEKSAKAQQKAQDEIARRERERKDIAARSVGAADSFELGGDANQNLSGQDPMFARTGQPFYSALSKGIENIKASAAPGAGWLDAIKGLVNKGTVKADEVEWSGVTDWLNLQNGRVTKEQVTAFLDANGVKVTETVLGGSVTDAGRNAEAMRQFNKPFDELSMRQASEVNTTLGADKDDTKYSQYQLPGGTNYQEVLLTLPATATPLVYPAPLSKLPDGYELVSDSSQPAHYRWAVTPPGQLSAMPWTGRQASEQEATAAALSKINSNRNQAADESHRKANAGYKSSHWDQKNVLAHIRLNDRVDATGAKTLFVEELQSDWGQAGKKNGFDRTAVTAKIVEKINKEENIYALFDQNGNQIHPGVRASSDEEALAKFKKYPSNKGVPSGPFVGKTDAWVSLAIKRVIKLAVDGGYDKVAFVNGEQSANRYKEALIKAVDVVTMFKHPDGKYDFHAKKDGGSVLVEQGISATRIGEVFGKAGDQLIEAADAKPGQDINVRSENMTVGGEGMRVFYDRIVPSVTKDVLRRLGVTPHPLGKQPGASNVGYSPPILTGYLQPVKLSTGQTQPGFTLTPAMREKAADGVPLFSKTDAAAQAQSTEKVQATVDAITANWANAPEIIVAHDLQDPRVPERVRQQDLKQRSGGATGTPEGFFYKGGVYLIASKLKTPNDIARVLAHEALGHYGLRGMFGDSLKPILREISVLRKADVRAKAIEYGLRGVTELDQLTAAEEVLAEMAQKNPQLDIVQRAVAAIRTWLRKNVPGFKNLALTDNEIIRSYLLPARGWVKRGQNAPNEPTAPDTGGAFSRGGTANLFQPNIWSTPDTGRMDKFIYEMQDGKVDLLRVQQAIAKSGQTIEEKWDARLAETLYPGRVAARSVNFLESEVRPLLEAMARQKLDMPELADYLHARGAEERNKQIAKVNPQMPDGGAGKNGKGVLMTTQAAKDYLAAVTPARKIVLDAMAKRVDAITAGTRSLLVTEGLEKQETVDAWTAAYKNYVPMFRDEVADGFATHPQGSGFAVKGSASKRAMGSTKEVTHILSHVFMQREAAITRGEKNRVAIALYGLAMSYPNPDFWATIRPGMKAAQISAELVAMGVDPMTAEVGMGGVPTIQTIDPNTGKVTNRPNPMYKNLPGAITLRINGEDRVLMLNVKSERGARLAESLKNLDGLTAIDYSVGVLHKYVWSAIPEKVAVGPATRWLASVNTQYNPAFGLVNLTRDVLGGVIHLGSTELRGNALKVLAQTPVAIMGIARELATGNQSGKWGKLYRQFVADGGQTGFKENFRDPNDRAKAIEKELKNLGRAKLSPGRAAHAVLDLLDGFNTTLENSVRLSAYSAALDKGMSRPQAARLGRELTVDFNRKGRMGRELGPLYAFFNASMQGTARTIEAVKGPTGAKIIAGGLGLGVLQALMLLAAGYDDDEVAEFVKTRSLVIPTNWTGTGEKKHILIPYPLGLHVLPNTGRVLSELALNGGKDIGKRSVAAIGEIAGALNPIGGGNILTADGALRTIAPTVIDPLIELGFNKNFAGTGIEKEGYGIEKDNRPGMARAKETTQRSTTGQVYMGISKAINSAMGGTDYEAGLASPTPERIRYLTQTVGGGVLRELEKGINASTASARGEKVNTSQIPVVGRFAGEVDDDQVQKSRYFEASKKLDKADSSFQAMKKAGDGDAAEKYLAEHPDLAMVKPFHHIQAVIGKLNRQAVQTIGDAAAIKGIDEDRVGLMRDLNEAVLESEKDVARETGKTTLGEKLKAAISPAAAAPPSRP